MTRRVRRGRSHRALYAVLALAALLVVDGMAVHLLGVLVLLAVVGCGGYLAGQRSHPAAKATMSTSNSEPRRLRAEVHAARGQLADARRMLGGHDAETARLRAELAYARAAADQARASAVAAWDQAGNRPPCRPVGDTAPLDLLDAERLAATPMSGARSLFRGQP